MSTPREGNSNFSLFAVQQLLPRLRAHRNALSVAAVALVISAAIGLANCLARFASSASWALATEPHRAIGKNITSHFRFIV